MPGSSTTRAADALHFVPRGVHNVLPEFVFETFKDYSDVVSVAAHERLLLRGHAVRAKKTVLKQQVDAPFAKLIGFAVRHYDSKISCSAAYGDRSPDERPRRRRAQAIFSPEWTTGQRNRVICKVSPQFHALVEDVDRALREEVDLLED